MEHEGEGILWLGQPVGFTTMSGGRQVPRRLADDDGEEQRHPPLRTAECRLWPVPGLRSASDFGSVGKLQKMGVVVEGRKRRDGRREDETASG